MRPYRTAHPLMVPSTKFVKSPAIVGVSLLVPRQICICESVQLGDGIVRFQRHY